jgi:chemotaxis protein CheC
VTSSFTDLQLDALRELANIGSGSAATALSRMLARPVDISVPRPLALPLADAVDACGSPEETVAAIVIGVDGDLTARVLLLIRLEHAGRLCALLGVAAGTEIGDSALREIGNIVGTSYLNALAAVTGLRLTPGLPQLSRDMLGAIVATLLAETSGAEDLALVLDSELDVSGEPCAMSFVLLPTVGGISDLLAPLGLAGETP